MIRCNSHLLEDIPGLYETHSIERALLEMRKKQQAKA